MAENASNVLGDIGMTDTKMTAQANDLTSAENATTTEAMTVIEAAVAAEG